MRTIERAYERIHRSRACSSRVKLIWNKSNQHKHTGVQYTQTGVVRVFFLSQSRFLLFLYMFFPMTLAANGYSRFMKWNDLVGFLYVSFSLSLPFFLSSVVHSNFQVHTRARIRFAVAVAIYWFSLLIIIINMKQRQRQPRYQHRLHFSVWWFSGSLTFSLSMAHTTLFSLCAALLQRLERAY